MGRSVSDVYSRRMTQQAPVTAGSSPGSGKNPGPAFPSRRKPGKAFKDQWCRRGSARADPFLLEIDSCHVVMLWQLWQCQQPGALQKRRIRGKAQELIASPGQVSWEMSGSKVLTESLIRPYIPSSTLPEWGLGV